MTLSQQQRKDLEYFVHKLTSGWTGSKWFLHKARELNVRSDASDTVAFLIHRGRFVYYRFTAKEAQASSHARELVPAALAARYFGHEWGGAVVGFTFDNSGAAASTSSLSSRDEAAQTSLRVVAQEPASLCLRGADLHCNPYLYVFTALQCFNDGGV